MSDLHADVVVVGAGPVGLLAAIAVAKQGRTVTILEKNIVRPVQSRAIGITPPTLGTFDRLNIAGRFLDEGVRVAHAGGYAPNRKLCVVDFTGLASGFPFVLSVPQNITESILESAAIAMPEITLLRGVTVGRINRDDGRCRVDGADDRGRPVTINGRFLIGADGAKSTVRDCCGIKFTGAAYPHTFVMADFPDTTGWGCEARLYFTGIGSVESFPLPKNHRRFVLRTPAFVESHPAKVLAAELPRRCGITVDPSCARWESSFGVQRFIASSFALPGLFLCGDAAHVMSPIGGQNMNVGFADAELAAWLIDAAFSGSASPAALAHLYHRIRRRSAAAAAGRAELMMRMGTSGGRLWNMLRNGAMSIALRTPFAAIANGMFTMLSLPHRDLPASRALIERKLAA